MTKDYRDRVLKQFYMLDVALLTLALFVTENSYYRAACVAVLFFCIYVLVSGNLDRKPHPACDAAPEDEAPDSHDLPTVNAPPHFHVDRHPAPKASTEASA